MQIKKKFIDNFTVTKLMLEKLSLLANERVTNQVLSQDDFNYAQFNDQIFDIDLPFQLDASVYNEVSDDEVDENLDRKSQHQGKRSDNGDRCEKLFNDNQQCEFKRSQD